MSRTRLVSQPASNGGHACEGEATEAMDCNEAECRGTQSLSIKIVSKCYFIQALIFGLDFNSLNFQHAQRKKVHIVDIMRIMHLECVKRIGS